MTKDHPATPSSKYLQLWKDRALNENPREIEAVVGAFEIAKNTNSITPERLMKSAPNDSEVPEETQGQGLHLLTEIFTASLLGSHNLLAHANAMLSGEQESTN